MDPARWPVRRDAWQPIAGRMLQPFEGRVRRLRAHKWSPWAERILALPEEAMRAWVDRRLAAVVRHAHATVPFHRDRWLAAGFDPRQWRGREDLARIPRMTKEDVAAHPARLLSSRYRGWTLLEARTGGTTAAPTPFQQTRGEIYRKNGTTLALRRRMGWLPGDRAAFLWGALRDAPPEPRDVVHRLLGHLRRYALDRSLFLPANDLSDARLDAHAEAIRRYRPTAMQAYPSAADLLARRVEATGRSLHVPIVVLTAEPVFPAQRERIARVLGARVFSFYGARECGWIAAECPSHRLHVNTCGVHVESVEGRLVVTDLVSRAMPLVRYEMGDLGRIDPAPCPCGDPRPVLTDLEGRVLDVLVLPSGRRVPGTVVDLRNYQVGRGILDSQVVQEEAGAVDVNYVPGPGFGPEALRILRERVDGYLGGEVEVRLHRVDRILPEPNGKVRWCISRLGGRVS